MLRNEWEKTKKDKELIYPLEKKQLNKLGRK